MYSLGSSPVLAFDLARMPAGDRLAELLLVALNLDEDGLAVIAARFDRKLDRSAAWLEMSALAAAGRRAGEMLAAGASPTAATPAGGDSADVILDVRETGAGVRSRRSFLAAMLEQAPLGDLDGLLACLRTEILGWTEDPASGSAVEFERTTKALIVLCDAAAALYLSDQLPAESVARLTAPWERAAAQLGAAYHRGPRLPGRGTAQLIRRARAATPEEMRQLRVAGDRLRSNSLTWTAAMQDASWAISLTGRVRDAAAAQLLLVLAVRAAHWPIPALAAGDWNLLSGALYARGVRDLMSQSTSQRLIRPFVEAFRPVSGRGLGNGAAS